MNATAAFERLRTHGDDPKVSVGRTSADREAAAPKRGGDDKIVRLEVFRALREKLAAGAPARPPARRDVAPTGVAALDEAVGGLRRGAVSEFSGSTGSGSLFLAALLEMSGRERWPLALVDAGDAFEPGDWDEAALRRVLWVRCREAKPALRAVDLLLRDGNLPLIVLDVQGLADRELARIPVNVWHRLQRVIEPTGGALVVLSRWPLVEGARVRLVAPERWGLEALRGRRTERARALRLAVREKGSADRGETERRTA